MSSGDNEQLTKGIDRLGKVLAVLYAHSLGDAELSVKAEHLSRCGFANNEIAELLGTTANNINVAIHRARHPKGKKAGKRKAKK